jgi:putative FmdB family regulatory protein
MPTYDYTCDACGHEFELFQSITENPVRKCPECGRLKLRRLFGTGAAIVFKGSGFYQTDYRSESYRRGAEQEKKQQDKPAGDKGAEKSSEKSSEASGEKGSQSASEKRSQKSPDKKPRKPKADRAD